MRVAVVGVPHFGMGGDGAVGSAVGSAASAEVEAPPSTRPIVAAVVSAVVSALWAWGLESILGGIGWISGTPRPALATSGERAGLAAVVALLAVTSVWVLLRWPPRGRVGALLGCGALAAQLSALLLLLLLPKVSYGQLSAPSLGWLVVVLVGGACGAALTGVAFGSSRPNRALALAALVVAGCWAVTAGAEIMNVDVCVHFELRHRRTDPPLSVLVGVGVALAGAAQAWRPAASRRALVGRAAVLVAVAVATWGVLVLTNPTAGLVEACTDVIL